MDSRLDDIREIRQMMERSSRVLSLGGSSGIIIGILALLYVAIYLVRFDRGIFSAPDLDLYSETGAYIYDHSLLLLVLSLVISSVFTIRRTRKLGHTVWNAPTRNLMTNLMVPLIAGGFMIIPDALEGGKHFFAYTLLFYGLGLFSCSRYSHKELAVMGILEIVLGIASAFFSELALFFWTLGFGALHIFYGALMYFRYER